MNDRTLRTLEYGKILEKVAFLAYTEKAKKDILELKPFSDAEKVKTMLDETEEADLVLFEHAVNPAMNFDDVTVPLERAEVLSMLSMGEVLKIERVLRVSRTLRGQILNLPDDRIKLLKEKANLIFVDKKLEDDISSAILSDTEMSDKASPELYSIRSKIKKNQRKHQSQTL